MSACRAIVKDEHTGDAPYFIYLEQKHSGAVGGGLRFNRRDNADRIARAINAALEAEGRLLVYAEELA